MRLLGVHNAVLAAVLTWVVEVHVVGVDLAYRFGSGAATSLGIAQIAGASLVASLLGWGVLAVMEKRDRRSAQHWLALAALFVLASLSLPIFAATTTAGLVALVILHIAVGVSSVPFLYRSASKA
jgi:hypothetical protein